MNALRRLLATGVASFALAATAASAADIAPLPAAPPVAITPSAAPGFDFAGPYVGLLGGAFFETPFAFENGRAFFLVGFNIVRNNLLFGVEGQLGAQFFSPGFVFEADLYGRAGVILGGNTLLYAKAGVYYDTSFVAFTAGGGVEVGIGERVSVFGEALGFFIPGTGFTGTELHVGVNFHFGN